MSHQYGTRSARARRAVFLGVVTAGLGLLAAACTSSSAPTHTSTSSADTSPAAVSTPSSSSAAPAPFSLSMTPTHVHNVNPTTPITVTAANGTLASVHLVNPAGKQVTGAMSADKKSWHATEVLGYGKTYKLTATGNDTTGENAHTLTRSFTTLTPPNMTMPYLDDIYGSPLVNGAKYGIAMIPSVTFDEPITDKAAAEKALQVTTSPHVAGSWTWVNDSTAHWRPQNFYTPGTKVTIAANVYGVNVGGGIYGETDKSVTFTIGRKQVTIATDTAPYAVNKVRVYRNNKLVRTMNTSMGEHSGEYSGGQYINFYTLNGTYTVLGFENPAHMCSDTYGLAANAPGGYPCENVYWSTKISTDGIYLHELDNTTWAQNSGQDVSHGCLNLDQSNAEWFFTNSLVGDPVIIHGAKGAPNLQLWEGGDWSVPWKTWLAGSALH